MNTKKNTDKQSGNSIKKNQYRGLKPFKKGQSGNPKGRPKYRTFSEIARERILQKKIIVNGVDIECEESLQQGIVDVLIAQSLNGNIAAIKELIDRMDGKAPQGIDITSNGKEIENNPVIQVVDSKTAEAVRKMFDGSS